MINILTIAHIYTLPAFPAFRLSLPCRDGYFLRTIEGKRMYGNRVLVRISEERGDHSPLFSVSVFWRVVNLEC